MSRGNLLNRKQRSPFLYVIARRIHESQVLKKLQAPWQSAESEKRSPFYTSLRGAYTISNSKKTS